MDFIRWWALPALLLATWVALAAGTLAGLSRLPVAPRPAAVRTQPAQLPAAPAERAQVATAPAVGSVPVQSAR